MLGNPTSIRRRAAAALALLAAGIVPLTATPALAATLTVTKCSDTGVAGDGSLRGEILAAADGDTITFSPVLAACPKVTLPSGQAVPAITLTSGQIIIDKNLTITGPGADALAVSRDTAVFEFRIFAVNAAHTVAISGLTITNGSELRGGGIFNAGTLDLTETTITGNTVTCVNCESVFGGGLLNDGTLAVTRSTVSNNAATCSGCDPAGGGIANRATLAVTDSTLSDNTACGSSSGGGGLWNAGLATVMNSTLSGNTAICGVQGTGGGLFTVSGTVTVTNSTLSNNAAACTVAMCDAHLGGGLAQAGQGTLTVVRTIVANSPAGGNCSGTITAVGANLEDANDCGFSLSNADDGLAALADNGGPTMTHALGPNSNAINAATGCPPPATDQRGVPRPQGAACDIGAYELAPAAVLDLAPPAATNPAGTNHTVTATVTVGGVGVPGWKVTFLVTGGPNVGAAGTCSPAGCLTGSTGTVSFTYTSNGVSGVDTIAAGAPTGLNGIFVEAGPVEKTWVAGPGGGGGGGQDDDDDSPGPNPKARITIIEKAAIGRTGSFGFHTKNLDDTTFRLAGDGNRDFKHLKAGSYTVGQDKKDGWRLDRIVCQDPSGGTKINVSTRRATIKLKAGEHVTCTFTNLKK